MEYSIDNYLKYYKDFTFKEEPFNDVDSVILSLIPYVNLDKVFEKNKKVTIETASQIFWSSTTEKEVNSDIIAVRKSAYLIRKLAKCKRYKDLKLYNYVYKVNEETQFGAVTIDLLDGTIYIAYKGTDSYVVGWVEDFKMSYIFPVTAQILAIKYLNENVKINNRKIIVGGHSKGGNLAIISSMYARYNIRKRIIKIYSNDGLGLRDEEFNSIEYKRISYKVKNIIPKNSFVGVLLNHDANYIVVDSYAKGIFQHDATTWKCYGSHLISIDLKEDNKKKEDTLYKWLKNYSYSEREKVVKSLIHVFDKLQITDLREIKKAKFAQVLKMIKNLKNVDNNTKKVLFRTIRELYSQYKNDN